MCAWLSGYHSWVIEDALSVEPCATQEELSRATMLADCPPPTHSDAGAPPATQLSLAHQPSTSTMTDVWC